jgi:PAS domain S-box-containing protein
MNKNLRNNIAFGFGIALLLLVFISVIAYKNILELEKVTTQINNAYAVSAKVSGMYSYVQDIVSGGRGYILTGNPVYFGQYEKGKTNVWFEFNDLKLIVKDDPAQLERVSRIEPLIKERIDISQTAIDIRNSKGRDSASSYIEKQKGSVVLSGISAIKDEIINAEKLVLEGMTVEEASMSRNTQYAILFGTLTTLIFLVIAYAIIIKDINRRYKVEAELRKSEKLYRTLIKNFPEGSITLYDKDLKYVIADGLGLREIGLTSETVEGKYIKDILPADVYKYLEPHYKKVFKGESGMAEIAAFDKIFQAAFVPLKNDNDEVEGGIVISQNITKRKTAEEELKKSERMYRTIMENYPNGTVVIYDKKLNILLAGGLELTKLGLTREALEGMHLGDVIQEGFDEIKLKLLDVFNDVSSTMEFSFSGFNYIVSNIPFKNEKGEIFAGLSISQNISELKEYERKLIQSRDYYLTLLEEFPTMIWRCSAEGKCDYHNRTWLKFRGRTFDEELGFGWAEGIHPDDSKKCVDTWLEAFNKREPFMMEYRIRRYDGEYRWIADHGMPYFDPDGGFAGYLGSARDVSERKENEEEIKKQNRLVKLLQDIAIASNEADTVEKAMEFAVNRICAYTGWPVGHVFLFDETKDELISTDTWCYDIKEKYADFIKATDLITFKEGIGLPGRVMQEKKPLWIKDITKEPNFPRAKIAHNLSIKSSFGFPVMLGQEVAAVMEFFTEDVVEPDTELLNLLTNAGSQIGRIIERKRTEKILVDSQRALADAQAIAHLGSWEWNVADGRLIWSDEMSRIYGLAPEDNITYEKYMSMIHPDDLPLMTQHIENSYKLCSAFEFEHRMFRKDGEMRTLSCKGKAVTDNAGNVIKMVGVGHDITELKRAEENLKEINRQLQETQDELIHSEKLAALGRISSSMAHEIRNPLANISAASQLLMNRNKGNDSLISYLDIILRNTETANRIIKELLDYASPRKIALKEGDLTNVIKNVCTLISPRCTQQGVNLICETGNRELRLEKMNEKKLEEAVMNFAVNSLDAMPRGGELNLLLKKDSESGEVCLRITDTGEGIPQENIDKIFEPFFTTKVNGTGLGMSLAHQIVKAHRGKLMLKSKPGEGTQVEIKLPLN